MITVKLYSQAVTNACLCLNGGELQSYDFNGCNSHLGMNVGLRHYRTRRSSTEASQSVTNESYPTRIHACYSS
jgi:hypothetical protein